MKEVKLEVKECGGIPFAELKGLVWYLTEIGATDDTEIVIQLSDSTVGVMANELLDAIPLKDDDDDVIYGYDVKIKDIATMLGTENLVIGIKPYLNNSSFPDGQVILHIKGIKI